MIWHMTKGHSLLLCLVSNFVQLLPPPSLPLSLVSSHQCLELHSHRTTQTFVALNPALGNRHHIWMQTYCPWKKNLTLLVPAPLSCLILVILSELTLALPNICLGQTQHNLFWQEAKGKRIWTVGGNRPYHHWCNFLKEASSAHCTQGMNGNKQRIRS